MGISLLKHHHFFRERVVSRFRECNFGSIIFCKQKRRHPCCWILNPKKIDVILFHSTRFIVTFNAMPCFFLCYSKKDFEHGRLTSSWNLKHASFMSGCFNWMMNQFFRNRKWMEITISIHPF